LSHCFALEGSLANLLQPSATGSSWEKYKKNFADDEIEEKKIQPLSDEYALPLFPHIDTLAANIG
jgi:hypothetical protein